MSPRLEALTAFLRSKAHNDGWGGDTLFVTCNLDTLRDYINAALDEAFERGHGFQQDTHKQDVG